MKKRDRDFFDAVLNEIREGEHSHFCETKQYIQHGEVSVYLHSVMVALSSYKMAKTLHIRIDERSLIRGALLHDYFLYDWHDGKPARRIHGFTHPGIALENAERDFELNDIERDIIRCHMFPLTIKPPTYREAVIVCLVDKYLSILETLNRRVLSAQMDMI